MSIDTSCRLHERVRLLTFGTRGLFCAQVKKGLKGNTSAFIRRGYHQLRRLIMTGSSTITNETVQSGIATMFASEARRRTSEVHTDVSSRQLAAFSRSCIVPIPSRVDSLALEIQCGPTKPESTLIRQCGQIVPFHYSLGSSDCRMWTASRVKLCMRSTPHLQKPGPRVDTLSAYTD